MNILRELKLVSHGDGSENHRQPKLYGRLNVNFIRECFLGINNMRPNLGLSKQMTYLIVVFFLFGSRAISKSFAASFQRFRFRGVLACISLYCKNSKYIFCPAQFVNCRQIVQQLNSSALCPSPKTENSSSVVHFVQRRNGRFHVVVK